MSHDEYLKVGRDRPGIDWSLIATAVDFYTARGYTYVEVPWVVPREATRLTWDGRVGFESEVGDLVASAEQGFLEKWVSGELRLGGLYVAVSPCFRYEPKQTKWHTTSFVKVELFCYGQDAVSHFYDHAWSLYTSLGIELLGTEERGGPYIFQRDINAVLDDEHIELGSYGFREAAYKEQRLFWSYGTGLAEPRTSLVISSGSK